MIGNRGANPGNSLKTAKIAGARTNARVHHKSKQSHGKSKEITPGPSNEGAWYIASLSISEPEIIMLDARDLLRRTKWSANTIYFTDKQELTCTMI